MKYELMNKDVIDKILVQISLARSQKIDDEAHNMLNSAQLLILENRIQLKDMQIELDGTYYKISGSMIGDNAPTGIRCPPKSPTPHYKCGACANNGRTE